MIYFYISILAVSAVFIGGTIIGCIIYALRQRKHKHPNMDSKSIMPCALSAAEERLLKDSFGKEEQVAEYFYTLIKKGNVRVECMSNSGKKFNDRKHRRIFSKRMTETLMIKAKALNEATGRLYEFN